MRLNHWLAILFLLSPLWVIGQVSNGQTNGRHTGPGVGSVASVGGPAGKDTLVCSGLPTAQAIGAPGVPGLLYHWTTNHTNQTNGLSNPNDPNPTVTLFNTQTLGYTEFYLLQIINPAIPDTTYDSVGVSVLPNTNVNVISNPRLDTIQLCVSGPNSNPITLPHPNPIAGLWYGFGVTDHDPGTFDPTLTGGGTFQLTYYAPCNNQEKQHNFLITVHQPQSNAGPPQQTCANIPIRLTGFPAGGRWAGPGIDSISGVITPANNPVGAWGDSTFTYIYTVFEGDRKCFAISQTTVSFIKVPVVTAPTIGLTLCSNDKPTQLRGQTPAGGTFTLQSPASNNGLINSGGIVSPAQRFCGTASVVRYTYVDPGTTCTAFKEAILTINCIDTAKVGSDLTVCSNAQPFILTGYSPPNGTWGPASPAIVSPTGLVTPTVALGGSTHKLFYTITNGACTSKDSLNITFLTSPGIARAAGLAKIVCANTPEFSLTGATPAGGHFRSSRDTARIYGINPVRGTFTPSRFLIGINKIYYELSSPNGCTSRDSFNLDVRDIPIVNAGSDFNVCAGNTVRIGSDTTRVIAPTKQFNYLWSGSQGTAGFSTTTRPNPFVTFSNGDVVPITLTYILRVTRIDTGRNPAPPFLPCANNDTLKVVVYPKPHALIRGHLDTKACEGDTIRLHATTNPRWKYQWITKTSTLTPRPTVRDSVYPVTLTGRYFLRVQDTIVLTGGVCADTSDGDSIYIKKRNHPFINGIINFCAGGGGPAGFDSLHVAFNPARVDTTVLAYQWVRNNQTILGAVDSVYHANIVANYRVVVADAQNGVVCYDSSRALFVDSIPKPYNNLVFNGTDTSFTVCSTQVPFTLVGPQDTAAKFKNAYQYRWQDGSPNRAFTIDSAGIYILTVYNQCGSASDTLHLTEVIASPNFTILNSGFRDTTVCKDIPFTLTGPDGNFYRWNIDASQVSGVYDSTSQSITINTGTPTGISIDPLTGDTTNQTIFVQLTVLSPNGCKYTDTLNYRIRLCEPVIYIPTAFTPQGDNVNDKWTLRSYSVLAARVFIYNRWGEQVYYAGTIEEVDARPWDGTFSGEKCVGGAYQYIVEYEGLVPGTDQTLTQRKTGTVTLIR